MNNASHDRSVPQSPASQSTWRRDTVAIIAILVFAAAFQLMFLTGIAIFDSASYSIRARAVADKGVNLDKPNLYNTRPLLLLPVALSYRFLGVSELTTAAYPMLCGAGVLIMTYLIGRLLYGSRVGLVAAFLMAVCPIFVIASAELLPDTPQAFYMALSVYLFLVGHRSSSRWRWLLFLGAGIALGAAYLVKVTAVLLLLFYGVFFVVYRRRISRVYWLVFLGAALVFFSEAAVYLWVTGNWKFRLEAFIHKPSGKPSVGRDEIEARLSFGGLLCTVMILITGKVVYGTGFFLLIQSFHRTPWENLPAVIALFTFAQIAGLVAVFAPAGIGVREGILLLGLQPLVGPGPAIVITGACRLWQTAIELVMAAIGWLALRSHDGKTRSCDRRSGVPQAECSLPSGEHIESGAADPAQSDSRNTRTLQI